MNRILFIHGKHPKPPVQVHRDLLLRCLAEGVRRIDPATAKAIVASNAFGIVSWGRLFYQEDRPAFEDLPWVELLLGRERQPGEDVHDPRPVRHRLTRLLYQIGDRIPWLIPLIPDPRVKLSIQETETYFSNRGNLGARVRELQKQPLREAARAGDRVLLIAHSMGSIIAYDSLWELDHLEGVRPCVDCFLTIGCPLGMNYVQKRLIGMQHRHHRIYPGNIRRWVNITAHGDLVALDPTVADDYHDMVRHHEVESITDRYRDVYNHFRDDRGLNVHKSYGYLLNPHVARVVHDWWNET